MKGVGDDQKGWDFRVGKAKLLGSTTNLDVLAGHDHAGHRLDFSFLWERDFGR